MTPQEFYSWLYCEDSQCEGFPKGKHRNLMKLGP